jgi:predicted esterase
MQAHLKEVVHTARYYTLGNLTPETREVWVCLHGYGQLGELFAPKFEALADKGVFVVAPEAFQRFYLIGDWNKVGCSWMTRDLREHDIVNNNRYIQEAVEEATAGLDWSNVRLTILGFSQGASTAWRFARHTPLEVANLILWAGTFPDEPLSPEKLAKLKIFSPMGDKDEYLTPERIAAHQVVVDKMGIKPVIVPFVGGHTIPADILEDVYQRTRV